MGVHYEIGPIGSIIQNVNFLTVAKIAKIDHFSTREQTFADGKPKMK